MRKHRIMFTRLANVWAMRSAGRLFKPSNQSGPAVPVAKPAADKIVETSRSSPYIPKFSSTSTRRGVCICAPRKTTL